MNLVEKAEKVMKFKMLVTTECASRNMRIPSTDKISEYINGGYPMDLKSFMADYTQFEGVFRRPLREVSPLEEELLKVTLALSDESLYRLWNAYITERYGDTSPDTLFKCDEQNAYIMVQDGKVHTFKTLKTLIENNWEDIFERIMLFPYAYDFLTKESGYYFAFTALPTMQRLLGFDINVDESLVTYKGGK